ncbi:MAG: GFA family protein [Halioglobus sp.]
MRLTGECFCGEVKYEIDGVLSDARSCHCSRCRKAFSSQASSYALVKPSEFCWVSGEEHLATYAGQQGFGLQFCKLCGSTLCGIYNNEVHGVALGCINEDPKIEIGRHIFVGSRASWEVMPEGVTVYSEHAPKNA